VKAADIEGSWSPRALRHTCVSLLAEAGTPVQHVADLVGDTTTRMTSSVYRHRLSPSVDARVGPMGDLFG
jgi:integrase